MSLSSSLKFHTTFHRKGFLTAQGAPCSQRGSSGVSSEVSGVLVRHQHLRFGFARLILTHLIVHLFGIYKCILPTSPIHVVVTPCGIPMHILPAYITTITNESRDAVRLLFPINLTGLLDVSSGENLRKSEASLAYTCLQDLNYLPQCSSTTSTDSFC